MYKRIKQNFNLPIIFRLFLWKFIQHNVHVYMNLSIHHLSVRNETHRLKKNFQYQICKIYLHFKDTEIKTEKKKHSSKPIFSNWNIKKRGTRVKTTYRNAAMNIIQNQLAQRN